jgi:hypothetical protein
MAEAFGTAHEHHGPFANDYAAQIWIDSRVTVSASEVLQTREV